MQQSTLRFPPTDDSYRRVKLAFSFGLWEEAGALTGEPTQTPVLLGVCLEIQTAVENNKGVAALFLYALM